MQCTLRVPVASLRSVHRVGPGSRSGSLGPNPRRVGGGAGSEDGFEVGDAAGSNAPESAPELLLFAEGSFIALRCDVGPIGSTPMRLHVATGRQAEGAARAPTLAFDAPIAADGSVLVPPPGAIVWGPRPGPEAWRKVELACPLPDDPWSEAYGAVQGEVPDFPTLALMGTGVARLDQRRRVAFGCVVDAQGRGVERARVVAEIEERDASGRERSPQELERLRRAWIERVAITTEGGRFVLTPKEPAARDESPVGAWPDRVVVQLPDGRSVGAAVDTSRPDGVRVVVPD